MRLGIVGLASRFWPSAFAQRAWIDCCRERRSPEITLEHAREILKISLACRQSNQQHRPIELSA